ncbi:MAG TPA: glycerol-3-phosphate 1-O-acyltransferase PlsY [Candidatus Cloacimonadota bacterium]|nr:glycerol-3-phosphate 1-O-acyltransferase PlsY [Candidatus Cloacimonadota bacterium]
MNPILSISLPIILAYLIGGIPTGFIFVKLIRKQDIRKQGSGNIGATNTMRVLGPGLAVIVLLIDIGKGVGAVILGTFLYAKFGINNTALFLSLVGIATILGHIYSVFLGFRGGKGVATAAGVFFMLTPIPLLIAFAAFILLTVITKYVSVGSIFGVFMLMLSEFYINMISQFTDVYNLILVLFIGSFVIYKHKENIKRLSEGRENQISFKRSDKE